jgi:hypothetical protein
MYQPTGNRLLYSNFHDGRCLEDTNLENGHAPEHFDVPGMFPSPANLDFQSLKSPTDTDIYFPLSEFKIGGR